MRTERCRWTDGRVTISYEVVGHGPPLVLIHGLSGSTRWWRRNAPGLAEHFRVYVVDLVGFGHSRGGQHFVLAEAAGHLASWIDQLGLAPVGLVGHSMGGLIAAELAADRPELVARLVLVAAAVLPFDRRGLSRALIRALPYLPPAFAWVLTCDACRAGPRTLYRAAREIIRADIRPKLEQVRAPTLVIWGQYDWLYPPAIGEQLTRALPDGRLVVLPAAAHTPMWNQPEAFNRLVIDFVGAGTQPAEAARYETGSSGGGRWAGAAG